MSKNSFLKEAMYENHPQYQQAILSTLSKKK